MKEKCKMNVFIVYRSLKNTTDKLVAISVRGSKGNIYYQEFVICPFEETKIVCNDLYIKTVKYIKESLIEEQGFYIRYIHVIGDIYCLPFQEYSWKRSSGYFHDLNQQLKRGTKLHESCRELYEYIKKSIKQVKIYYNSWGFSNGCMWSNHKAIKIELGKLARDMYYDEDKALKEFLEWN